MPLRGASGPGATARAKTSPPSMRSTAKRGTPSPMTICERSVASAANRSNSTTTRSDASGGAAPQNVTASPAATARGLVSAASRSFGPWRSNSRPIARPERCAAAAHVGRAATQVVVRAVPSSSAARSRAPASTSASRTPGGSVAGPSVATIFVRRSSMRPSLWATRRRRSAVATCIAPDAAPLGRRSARPWGA